MASETSEIVDPAVFLGVVFLLVVGLIVVYKVIVNQSCACLSDPGGKDAGRKKKQNGYSPVSGRETESSDGDVFVPPTLIVENEEPNLEEGELVGPQTLSAYSVYSAYGDTISLDQSYLTERGLGRLKLDISYKPDESRLKILVIEGDSLPSKEQGGASQFKIHLTLLPKRQQKFKSKTQSRYSPRFNETFEFKDVLESDLFTLAVRFRLYGGTGTGKLVGETFLQLADVARAPGHVIQGTWRAFREVKTREKKK